MDVQIGSKVLIEGGRSGVVRYYGPVGGKAGSWVGVELDFALGKNDGTVAGKQYFRCKPLHGIFVNPSKVITMPMSPNDNSHVDLPQKHPPISIHSIALSKKEGNNLADRLQQASVIKEVPNQTTISKTGTLPPIESPFKMPIKKPTELVDKTPVRTPLQSSTLGKTPLSSAVRNVEDLQAEIRRLHEQKLELIDKLAESDRMRNSEDRKSSSKIETQLLDLQFRLKEKEALVEELAKEKENIVSQLAKVQSQHFSEITKLRLEIEDLNMRNSLNRTQLIDRNSIEETSKREASIETGADHHRLSVIRSFDEERDAIRKRLEVTQEQLCNVIHESNLAKEALEKQLNNINMLYQQSQAKEGWLASENARLNSELHKYISEDDGRKVELAKMETLREQLKGARDECSVSKLALKKLEQSSIANKLLYEDRERELLQVIDDKNKEIGILASSQVRETSQPNSSSIESVRFRVDQSVHRISQLQTAYMSLRSSYEQLRDAKRREEAYFLSQIGHAESSVASINNAKYDQLLSENSSLTTKLEQYRKQVEELNARLINGMDTMDKLEVALSTIDRLSGEIDSLNLRHQQEVDNLNMQLRDIRKASGQGPLSAVSQNTLAQSTKENNRNADNLQVEKDFVIDSLERDIRVLEKQLSRATSGSMNDISCQSSDLMKRIGRLKSSFKILDQSHYFKEVVELEKKLLVFR